MLAFKMFMFYNLRRIGAVLIMDWLEIREFLIDSFKVIITVAAIFFVMFYVFSITMVVGNSMNPTLENGEVLILDKIKYRFSDIKRGDIVSIQHGDSKFYIKRIIGLPGENIKIRNNILYINNVGYEEPYLAEGLVYDGFELSTLGYQTIPDGMYFVLGDNRIDSADSRSKSFGLISKDEIVGKIDLRIWPLNKFKLF